MIKIRSSILSSWNDCPRRNALKLMRDVIDEAGFQINYEPKVVKIYNAFGKSIHKGSQRIVENKISNQTISLEDTQDVCIEKLREEVSDGVEWDDISPNMNNTEKQVLRTSKMYFMTIVPLLEPIETEKYYEAKIDENYLLTGHLDILCEKSLRDTKTGKSAYGHKAQLGGYAILRLSNSDMKPEALFIDHLRRTSMKKNLELPTIVEYKGDTVKNCIDDAHFIINQIISQTNMFLDTCEPRCYPANTMSFICSEKYCPAYNTDWCKIK